MFFLDYYIFVSTWLAVARASGTYLSLVFVCSEGSFLVSSFKDAKNKGRR